MRNAEWGKGREDRSVIQQVGLLVGTEARSRGEVFHLDGADAPHDCAGLAGCGLGEPRAIDLDAYPAAVALKSRSVVNIEVIRANVRYSQGG